MKRAVDRTTSTWMRVEEWATARIDAQRKRNDGPLDAVQTAHLRGQVAALKELLALDKPAPETRTDDT